MCEQESESETFAATIRDPRFNPGARMSVAVQDEERTELSDKYVITSAQHMASDHSGLAAGGGDVATYQGSITLVASGRTWMPTRRHTRPTMAGL